MRGIQKGRVLRRIVLVSLGVLGFLVSGADVSDATTTSAPRKGLIRRRCDPDEYRTRDGHCRSCHHCFDAVAAGAVVNGACKTCRLRRRCDPDEFRTSTGQCWSCDLCRGMFKVENNYACQSDCRTIPESNDTSNVDNNVTMKQTLNSSNLLSDVTTVSKMSTTVEVYNAICKENPYVWPVTVVGLCVVAGGLVAVLWLPKSRCNQGRRQKAGGQRSKNSAFYSKVLLIDSTKETHTMIHCQGKDDTAQKETHHALDGLTRPCPTPYASFNGAFAEDKNKNILLCACS
ncbi:uncharacterized protein [Ptychodera flava]|uniref:uncharacterized protein isoform X2 n=1 Tax=Ptychodera flava TaxID=63121 RepID=UPI003969FF46